MSVLGVVIRIRASDQAQVRRRLAATPGVDLGPDAGDTKLVAVIESTADTPAAAIMGEIAGWPEVHNLSLVFEHSDDALADGADPAATEFDFHAWRGPVGDFARRQQAATVSVSVSHSAASGAGEAR